MLEPIAVTLPADLQSALEDITRKEGISRDEVIGRAIKEHLFLRQFRLLRERMTPKAQAQGISTDQDVFDLVS